MFEVLAVIAEIVRPVLIPLHIGHKSDYLHLAADFRPEKCRSKGILNRISNDSSYHATYASHRAKARPPIFVN